MLKRIFTLELIQTYLYLLENSKRMSMNDFADDDANINGIFKCRECGREHKRYAVVLCGKKKKEYCCKSCMDKRVRCTYLL